MTIEEAKKFMEVRENYKQNSIPKKITRGYDVQLQLIEAYLSEKKWEEIFAKF